jgi:hypothetical protein
MSSGEQTENIPNSTNTEDFSPPTQDYGERSQDLGGPPASYSERYSDRYSERYSERYSGHTSGSQATSPSEMDVLDLIVKFQLMGESSQTLINNLRRELGGQSERLLVGVLIERSYLTEEEMDAVVLARYLLACAKLTMPQLELVMDEIKETKAPLWVALVAKGWLKMSDVV